MRVLMVCMGNICRSPTAHGVLEKLVADAGWADRIAVDSAGTHGYHVGEPPDERAQQHAARRGYDLSAQRARALRREDFAHFDLVLVMDAANERAARALCPSDRTSRLRRLTDFCRTHSASEVPDPYYGGARLRGSARPGRRCLPRAAGGPAGAGQRRAPVKGAARPAQNSGAIGFTT